MDLIERQKAIDAHYEYCNKHPDAGFPVWSLKILEDLPSAQPEPPTDDCISRKAAITLPVMPKEHREYQTINLDDAYEQGWNDLQKCIESLPSTQPQLPEWAQKVEECRQSAPSYIHNPLAWALYQTWKEYDR